MTNYIRLRDHKYPAHPSEEYPHKVFPEILPIPTQEAFGYAVVFPAPKPSDDAIEIQPFQTPRGTWQQAWRDK